MGFRENDDYSLNRQKNQEGYLYEQKYLGKDLGKAPLKEVWEEETQVQVTKI